MTVRVVLVDDQAMVRRTAAWLHDLDPAVRAGISTLAKRSEAELAEGLARLRVGDRPGPFVEVQAEVGALVLDEVADAEVDGAGVPLQRVHLHVAAGFFEFVGEGAHPREELVDDRVKAGKGGFGEPLVGSVEAQVRRHRIRRVGRMFGRQIELLPIVDPVVGELCPDLLPAAKVR
jgi:hypothetical protein